MASLNSQVEIDLATLRTDVSHIGTAVNKMSQSIETVVDLAKMMAVQEAKFDALEHKFNSFEKIASAKEAQDQRYRSDTSDSIKTLEQKLNDSQMHLHIQLSDHQDKARNERNVHHKQMMDSIEEYKKSVDKVTKMFYYASGAMAVSVFVISLLPIKDLIARLIF